jgi:formiminoglutamase
MNLTTIYRRCSKPLRSPGDRVKAGEPIAIIVAGAVELPEFEVWLNGVPVNPENYITFKRVCLYLRSTHNFISLIAHRYVSLEYTDIFLPVPAHLQHHAAALAPECWGNATKHGVRGFDWDWAATFNEALVGVRLPGMPNSVAAFREELYSLDIPDRPLQILDLGDIELDPASASSTHETLAYALQMLLARGVFPIVLGENMSSCVGVYEAVKAHRKSLAAALILPSATLGNAQEPLADGNLSAHLLADYGRELETFNLLGYQGYLSAPTDLRSLAERYCECLRLGASRDNIMQAEPLLRDADVLAASVSAIRQSDAPAAAEHSPNGLYAEEMCRLLQFAAASDKLLAAYLGGFSLTDDPYRQTTKLLAQLVWHIADGLAHRTGDDPAAGRSCRKWRVELGRKGQQLLFYQGKASDKWWMRIPETETSPERIIPCLKEDYDKTLRMEIPDRWLWYYKKSVSD